MDWTGFQLTRRERCQDCVVKPVMAGQRTTDKHTLKNRFAGFALCLTLYNGLTSCFRVSPCTTRQKHPAATYAHVPAGASGYRNVQVGCGFQLAHGRSRVPNRQGGKKIESRSLTFSPVSKCSFLAIPALSTPSKEALAHLGLAGSTSLTANGAPRLRHAVQYLPQVLSEKRSNRAQPMRPLKKGLSDHRI